MKTTKLFLVLALVLIFIVLLPTTVFPQQYQLPRGLSVTKTFGFKPASLNKKTDSSASVWYVSPYSFGTITEAKKTSSTDAYHGNFSGRFQASGVMKKDSNDLGYYSQINFLRILDQYHEQPDTFIYHIKSGVYQYLYSITIGYDGDTYWALLNPRRVSTDDQWHTEVVENPKFGSGDPFNYLVFVFCFTDNWSSTELPFSADILIDYVYGKFKDGRIVVYEDFEDTTTDVPRETSLPLEFKLEQNYPNPFNPVTTIKFSVPQMEQVNLKVYDMLGREVAMLVNEEKAPGSYEVKFDGSNLASGTYFYRLQAGNFVQVKKMLLMK